MNIQLGDTLTVTFPRDQVNTILALLVKSPLPWETTNPAITTIMTAAKEAHELTEAAKNKSPLGDVHPPPA